MIFIRPGGCQLLSQVIDFLKVFSALSDDDQDCLRLVFWWFKKKPLRLWVMLLWKGFSESCHSNTTKAEKERFRDAQYVKALINQHINEIVDIKADDVAV